MMEDSEFRMSPFAVQVKLSVGIFVELDSPVDEFFYLRRGVCHYFFHGFGIAQPVAGNHGVLDVFVEIVHFEVCDRSHAALGEISVGFFKFSLAYKRHAARGGHFQGEAHSGYAGADHQIVIFVCHIAEKKKPTCNCVDHL